LQYFFSKLYGHPEWLVTLYGNKSFNFLYEEMYGNPFLLAKSFEPLYPPNLKQPDLELPFKPGKIWSLTGGPHSAWGPDGALAALDFAPASMEHGCVGSQEVVTASAAGTVVRSQNGVVVIDLDGDGYEQTGWSILYLHIASKERVQKGALVDVNDQIGYPSCEGGVATGTHVHIARKYNGEWILADGPIPFVLSGYRAYSGEKPYLGKLINNDKEVIASVFGDYYSNIKRTE
jgi:murein DD-endopeptidase MepM/ murein hydrolase activator NlpD